MSVKIDGIGKLRANYYSKLVIREDPVYGKYHVSVKGDKITYETDVIGDRFSEEFRKKSDIEQVKEIIEDYLRNGKICQVTDLINLPGYGEQRFNVIYGNLGYRQMLLQLFDKEFKDIYNKILQKFYQDRFDFCYEENGIKTFRISAGGSVSGYNICFGKLYKGAKEEECFKHIILKNNQLILTDSEKKFIGDFIINVFSKFGEEIIIERIYDDEFPWIENGHMGYIFRCGDVKIYIDKFYPLLYILVMVGNYNLGIKSQKEQCMKRQLRMEEF